MKEKKTKVETSEKEKLAEAGNKKKRINSHGRIFEGKVISKHEKRVVIAFERAVYVRKYERYKKSRTKIHARLPAEFEDKIHLGNLIKVQECRPLSKLIHFIVIDKIKSKSKEQNKSK